MPTSHIPSLTPLRGIAAVWVMLFHIDVCLYYRDLGSLLPQESSGLIANGYLWVDFFFILSGFVISHVYCLSFKQRWRLATFIHFVWARFTRIYPVHVVTLLLLIPFYLLVPHVYPGVIDSSWVNYFSWNTFSSELFLSNSIGAHPYLSWNIVSWSIGAEWWTYMFAGFLLAFTSRLTLLANWILASTSIAVLGYFSMNHSNGNLDMTYDFGFVRCLCEFIIGIVVYRSYCSQFFKQTLSTDTAISILLFAIVSCFYFRLNDILSIPVFAFLVLCAAYNRGYIMVILESSLPRYLGKVSYSIYMVHGLVFHLFWYGFPYLTREYGLVKLSTLDKLLYVVCFIGLTLALSHVMHIYVEVHCRRWLNNRWSILAKRVQTRA